MSELGRNGRPLPAQRRRGAASRVTVRSMADMLSNMSTQRVNGPADPVPTLGDIIFTKKFTQSVKLKDGSLTLSVADLLRNVLPGGFSAWDRVRIQRFDIYGPAKDSAFLAVDYLEPAAGNGDMASFVDYGTQGAMRPAIHFIPAFSKRIEWISTSSTDNIITLRGEATDSVVVQFTATVRSTRASE
jgi:hypothetical protein